MRIIRAAVYTLALACANMALAEVDSALLTGEMAKLVPSEPKALPEVELLDMADGVGALPKGQWQVVNFWATWCVPCLEEMPALEALAQALPEVAVTAVAVGPNPVPKIKAFMEEVGSTRIGLLRDPRQQFAREAGVLGLPVTVIVNPEGEEVARLIGGADWGGADALAVMASLMK